MKSPFAAVHIMFHDSGDTKDWVALISTAWVDMAFKKLRINIHQTRKKQDEEEQISKAAEGLFFCIIIPQIKKLFTDNLANRQ